MKAKKFIAGALSVVTFLWSSAKAGDIDNVLNGLVTYQTVDPHIIKSESYTGLTGGKFRFRLNNNLLNLPVFTFNSPRATLSCSGLDLDAGLISWMNLDTFEQLLEQSGSSLAWGVMIGLIYSIPGVADAFTRLNKLGRMVQTITQNSCQMGKVIGTTIGTQIFEKEKDEAVSEGLGQNVASTVSEMLKRYKNTLKAQNFFYYFPYTYLKNKGVSDELTDLLVAFFGVYGWTTLKDGSSTELCNSVDCLKDGNIRVYVQPPRLDVVQSLLTPGVSGGGKTITLPHCEWGTINVSGAAPINVCTSITERTYTLNKGLVDIVREKLEEAIDGMVTGSSVSDQTKTFVNAYGLADVINGLALLKRYYLTNNPSSTSIPNYDAALNNVSTYISLKIIKDLIREGRVKLEKSALPDAFQKANKSNIELIEKRLDEADKIVNKLTIDYEREVKDFMNNYKMYEAIRKNLDKALKVKFGAYAVNGG